MGSIPVASTPVSAAVRIGPFVFVVDGEGLRHAVRLGAVLALSDGDICQDTTMVQLPGSRFVLVPVSLEEVVGWFT